MPYTIPTASELKARYSEFSSLDDGIVDDLIAEASRFVDDGWAELDYHPAIMALAAHLLVEDGFTGRPSEAAGPITGSKLGDAQDSYAGLSSSEQSGEYTGTSYGRKYMRLRAVNCQGIILL
jgi:hypothetical protein